MIWFAGTPDAPAMLSVWMIRPPFPDAARAGAAGSTVIAATPAVAIPPTNIASRVAFAIGLPSRKTDRNHDRSRRLSRESIAQLACRSTRNPEQARTPLEIDVGAEAASSGAAPS